MTRQPHYEVEARAATLLVMVLTKKLRVPAFTLIEMVAELDGSMGMPAPHPAMERDHDVNEAAARLLSDTLRRAARTARTNDNADS